MVCDTRDTRSPMTDSRSMCNGLQTDAVCAEKRDRVSFVSPVDLQQSEKLLPRLVDCVSIARFDRSTMGHRRNQAGIYSSPVIIALLDARHNHRWTWLL